jgi:hypothetical protein
MRKKQYLSLSKWLTVIDRPDTTRFLQIYVKRMMHLFKLIFDLESFLKAQA